MSLVFLPFSLEEKKSTSATWSYVSALYDKNHEATPWLFSLLVQGYSTHEILAEIALFPAAFKL